MGTMMEYQNKLGLFKNQNNQNIKLKGPEESPIIDLASGFATLHNNNFVLTEINQSEADQARALTLSKTVARETAGLSYSLNTTTLFDIYYNDFEVLKSFEFREEVFRNFIDNLGFPTLHIFVETQMHNNYITPSHVGYIKETLDLLSGHIDRRHVSNESWSSLLYHDRGDYTKSRADIKTIITDGRYHVLSVPYWELISIWLNTVPSITDLIWFVKLVWGRPLPGQIQ